MMQTQQYDRFKLFNANLSDRSANSTGMLKLLEELTRSSDGRPVKVALIAALHGDKGNCKQKIIPTLEYVNRLELGDDADTAHRGRGGAGGPAPSVSGGGGNRSADDDDSLRDEVLQGLQRFIAQRPSLQGGDDCGDDDDDDDCDDCGDDDDDVHALRREVVAGLQRFVSRHSSRGNV